MVSMFGGATSFNQSIGDWDVSNVITMVSMFEGATSFNQDISSWCVTNIASEPSSFSTNSPLSDSNKPIWGTCPKTPITDANFQTAINTCLNTNPEDGMCTDSEYGEMPDWDVSNVTDISSAFDGRNTFNGDISGWDTSSVTNMQGMFSGADAFNQDIGSWDVRNVTDMSYMFYANPDFNQDIGDWDTSSVTDMSHMFLYAYDFNQDISEWDTSSVNVMESMFYNAYDFNQDISGWCVTNIDSEPIEFSINSSLTESNKPIWGTCPTAGVDDQNQLDISIYPNPTSDIVFIEGNYSQLKVVVYDILGKQVINKSVTNSIDISQLEKGVYILQLSDGAKLTTQRIIKN